jgi:flagellar motor switch protein FliM
LAKPGVIGKYMGIQILDIIDKDVENYDWWISISGRD